MPPEGSDNAYSDIPDIFNEGLLPILNMWHDLGTHFSKEDVPNPIQFIQQYDRFVWCAFADPRHEAPDVDHMA